MFLLGGPGSGKDIFLKLALAETRYRELDLAKLDAAIHARENIRAINERRSIIINGNADDVNRVMLAKTVLESLGYHTGMVYVYTTDNTSRSRNSRRAQSGAKTISESTRERKYMKSVRNMKTFAEQFSPYVVYDNSRPITEAHEHYIVKHLRETKEHLAPFLENRNIDPEINSLFEQFVQETYGGMAGGSSAGNKRDSVQSSIKTIKTAASNATANKKPIVDLTGTSTNDKRPHGTQQRKPGEKRTLAPKI